MSITKENVLHVAGLARLELSEDEVKKYETELNDVLKFMDKLNELDTDGVEPSTNVLDISNVFRDDVVTNGDGSEATLANAPVKKDGGFKVPKTIGE